MADTSSTTTSTSDYKSEQSGASINDSLEETQASTTNSTETVTNVPDGVRAPTPSLVTAFAGNDTLSELQTRLTTAGAAQLLAALNIVERGPEEGKAHLRSNFRWDIPLRSQLFKEPPAKRKRKTLTPRTGAGLRATQRAGAVSPPNEHIHEGNMWLPLAMEDVEHGLKRLIMAAKDMHRQDDTKTESEYFSEKLAEVLKKQELAFDPKFLE